MEDPPRCPSPWLWTQLLLSLCLASCSSLHRHRSFHLSLSPCNRRCWESLLLSSEDNRPHHCTICKLTLSSTLFWLPTLCWARLGVSNLGHCAVQTHHSCANDGFEKSKTVPIKLENNRERNCFHHYDPRASHWRPLRIIPYASPNQPFAVLNQIFIWKSAAQLI